MSADSFTPAIEGTKAFTGWLGGLFGEGAGRLEIFLLSIGVAAGAATIIAWMLVAFSALALTMKFRAVFFWGFAFLVVFVALQGMGVAFR